MADIQLLDFRDGRDGADVANRQAVACVDREAKFRGLGGSIDQGAQGRVVLRQARITTRVQLDRVGAEVL